ncbi:phage late control D family protein [Nannocystaceae bacterium ST9]
MSLVLLANDGLREPAECVVKIGGMEIGDLYPHLGEVVVEASRKGAAVCRLSFESYRDQLGRWVVSDDSRVRPWAELAVFAVFGSRREPVFEGFIKKVDVKVGESTAKVEVSGQDCSLLLDREHVRKPWSTAERPLSDQQIVQQIASAFQLTADVPAKGLNNQTLTQDGSAAAFIGQRAEANGYEFHVRGKQLYFGPPRLDGQPQPTILVHAGPRTNCMGFDVTFDGHRPDAVRILRSDANSNITKTVIEPDLRLLGSVAADSRGQGLGQFVWDIQPSGGSEAELQAAAKAKANDNAWKLRAEGELDGSFYGHVLLTHETVRVDGIGPTYGGVWYVDAVRHAFSASGYRQRFVLIRNATGERGGAG